MKTNTLSTVIVTALVTAAACIAATKLPSRIKDASEVRRMDRELQAARQEADSLRNIISIMELNTLLDQMVSEARADTLDALRSQIRTDETVRSLKDAIRGKD